MTIQEQYQNDIVPKLKADLGITNLMALPRLMKIVVNCGIGREALADKKVIEKVSAQLAVITGQKPSVRRAKRAISTFKLRAGDAVGLKVTLRGRFMSDFFTKLVTIALPRVRDFRGVSLNGFDGHGNYTLGISDQTIFAELEYTLIDKTRGFEVTFVTRAENDDHARKLLTYLGMPFEK